MQGKVSIAVKCVISVLVLDFLCFFIGMSLNIIATGITTEPHSYDIFIKNEQGEYVKEYTHYHADGEDKRLAEYDEKKVDYRRFDYRTPMSWGTQALIDTVTMAFTFSIFCAFVYTALWRKGDKDNNLSVYSGAPRDKHYGLKVGLMATAPFALLYLLLLVNKFLTFWPGIYGVFKIVNYYLYPLVNLAYGEAISLSQLPFGSLALLLLTLIPIPLAAWLGYYCGNSEISIKNKIVYSKEKK